LGELIWRTRLVLTLRKYLQGLGPGRHGLEKLEHRQHHGSLVLPLGLRVLGDLVQFSQLEDSGALFVERFRLMS
jgi:hypothetical protein